MATSLCRTLVHPGLQRRTHTTCPSDIAVHHGDPIAKYRRKRTAVRKGVIVADVGVRNCNIAVSSYTRLFVNAGAGSRVMTKPDPDFEEFFIKSYGSLLRSITAATGDAEGAKDAVQDAFVKAATRWKKIRNYEKPEAWVRRAALNRSRDLNRSNKRRRAREVAVAPSSMVEAASRHVDGKLHVTELLSMLPPKQRAAAALFYVEDLSVEEIAVTLNVSAGTVKYNLSEARSTLRSVFAHQAESELAHEFRT